MADGRTLTLAASGWTLDDKFVLYDHETESLWFPGFAGGSRTMVCVAGELQEEILRSVPYERTEWSSWIAIVDESLLMVVK